MNSETNSEQVLKSATYQTAHLKANLRDRTLRAGSATAATQIGKFFIGLGSVAVLARLLEPKDFGLVAMATVFTGTVGVFKDFGFTTATIQKEDITHAQVSNLFWINMAAGIALALFVAAAAPLVAAVFAEPRLKEIIWALSINYALGSLNGQHSALLSREMRFRELGNRDLLSLIVGQATAIIAAWNGLGVWSLVIASIVSGAVGVVTMWQISDFRPRLPVRNAGTRNLLKFGANLTGVNFLNQVTRRADGFLIGRYCGAEAAGLYARATSLLRNPLNNVLKPINAVLRPALSRLQDEPERFRKAYLQVFDLIALVALPFTAACLALAEPIIHVLYGPKWSGAIPIFSAFTLIAMYMPLSATANWIFISHGKGKEMLRFQVILSTVTLVSFMVGIPWGPTGVALSYSLAGVFIRLPLIFYLTSKVGPVTLSDFWKGLGRHLPCWIVIYLGTSLVVGTVEGKNPFLQLGVGMAAVLVLAAAVIAIYPPERKSFKRLVNLAKFREWA